MLKLIIMELATFLKSKSAYSKFMRNCKDVRCQGALVENEDKVIYSMAMAFLWAKTKEGYGYWGNLSKEYLLINEANWLRMRE